MKPPASPGLDAVQEAIRRADRRLAHDLCVSLTLSDPDNEQAWRLLVGLAESAEEKISALNQVLRLNPRNGAARQALYEVMQGLLRKDPFLIYQGETNSSYQITTLEDFRFIHPKDRAISAPFPPPAWSPGQSAQRWLGWAALGLIPAGLGTLVLAPVAMRAAFNLIQRSEHSVERRRAWVVLCGAAALWLIALVLVFILILHLP